MINLNIDEFNTHFLRPLIRQKDSAEKYEKELLKACVFTGQIDIIGYMRELRPNLTNLYIKELIMEEKERRIKGLTPMFSAKGR